MSDRKPKRFPDIVAHRGGSRYPENSLAAFKHAASYGVEQVELDIHLTKDRHLIVMHDSTLDQTSFGEGVISRFTLADIQSIRLRQIDEVAPSLNQALEALAPSEMRVRVEIKPGESPEGFDLIYRNVIQLIDKYDMLDRVIIMSFDPAALTSFARSKVPTSLSVWPADQESEVAFERVVERAAKAGIGDLGLFFGRTTPQMLAIATEAGLTAGVWTVNDASRLDYWLRQPLAYILTDQPDVARRIRETLEETSVGM